MKMLSLLVLVSDTHIAYVCVESVHAPTFLEVRIETFLQQFEKRLKELSAEDFAEHVDSLTTKKKESDSKQSPFSCGESCIASLPDQL